MTRILFLRHWARRQQSQSQLPQRILSGSRRQPQPLQSFTATATLSTYTNQQPSPQPLPPIQKQQQQQQCLPTTTINHSRFLVVWKPHSYQVRYHSGGGGGRGGSGGRGGGGGGRGGGGGGNHNFHKRFLEPAERGELKHKHQSGIPKLAGKAKHKGHGLHGYDATGAPMTEVLKDLEDFDFSDMDALDQLDSFFASSSKPSTTKGQGQEDDAEWDNDYKTIQLSEQIHKLLEEYEEQPNRPMWKNQNEEEEEENWETNVDFQKLLKTMDDKDLSTMNMQDLLKSMETLHDTINHDNKDDDMDPQELQKLRNDWNWDEGDDDDDRLDKENQYWNEDDFQDLLQGMDPKEDPYASIRDQDGFAVLEYDSDDMNEDENAVDYDSDDYEAGDQSKKNWGKPFQENPTKDDDDNEESDMDDDDDDEQQQEEEEEEKGPPRRSELQQQHQRQYSYKYRGNPEDLFFEKDDIMHVLETNQVQTAPPGYDTISPLREDDLLGGDTVDDFLDVMANHPTKYAEYNNTKNAHADSRREPKPTFYGRMQPPKEFVTSYQRFLYVTNLPPSTTGKNDEEEDFQDIVTNIARIFNVSSTQVVAANSNSGFVGFPSMEQFDEVYQKGPRLKGVARPIVVSEYTSPKDSSEKEQEFVNNNNNKNILRIDHIPPGFTKESLLYDLFPPDTELGTVYNPNNNRGGKDVYQLSPTSALLRMETKEQMDSLMKSQLFQTQCKELGKYHIRYFKARRELVHKKFGGPNNSNEIREMGTRLIVDHLDMPTKQFFINHAEVLSIRNIHPLVTKKDLYQLFTPFYKYPNDPYRYMVLHHQYANNDDNNDTEFDSVEFVKCAQGKRYNKAYIGFDNYGEAKAALDHYKNGRIPLEVKLGDTTTTMTNIMTMKLIQDRPILMTVNHDTGLKQLRVPKKHYQYHKNGTDNNNYYDYRSERTEQELLDNLNNWKQYVNQEDIDYICDVGNIPMEVLDETLRSIRYNNKYFKQLDLASKNEKLHSQKASGDEYKGLVQDYIATLKECIATPDDPGYYYEALHYENEAIDVSVFQDEKKRQESIQEKRSQS